MRRLRSHTSPQSGFSLLEIVVVIAVIGLLTAGLAAMFTAFLKSGKARIAADNSTAIQQSLQRFVERYGRLPCPAVPTLAPGSVGYGSEDTVTTSCPTTAVGTTGMARGVVPWITLGLPLEQVQDGYAHMFTYHVSIDATQRNASNIGTARGNMTTHSGTPPTFGIGAGRNQLNTCWSGAAAPPATENSCNTRAIVLLVSHGENGSDGYTSAGGRVPASTVAAEVENVNADTAFSKGDPTAAGFDDVVFDWAPDDLFEPLVRRGTLRPATVVTTDTLKEWAARIAGETYASGTCAIPVAPASTPTDAWGANMVYQQLAVGNPCATPAADAFRVRSLGTDGFDSIAAFPAITVNPATGLNDDLWLTVRTDSICSQLLNKAPACP